MSTSLNGYLNHWQDKESIEKIKASTHSPEWHVTEITNHLVELTQRFVFGPTRDKLVYWSKDLVQSNIKEHQVKEVCQRIGRTFEKYPTLAQIFELLRSKPIQEKKSDPDAKKDHDECIQLKQKWIETIGIEYLPKMCQSYSKNCLKMNIGLFESHSIESTWIEMLVLLDWKRSGFGGAEDILRQGIQSQLIWMKNNSPEV